MFIFGSKIYSIIDLFDPFSSSLDLVSLVVASGVAVSTGENGVKLVDKNPPNYLDTILILF